MSEISPSAPLLEVCVDSVASALAAERGGAARVELCSGLVDGGLTPSFSLIRAVVEALRIPVMVLIRTRPGDFCYSDADLSVMKADIGLCRQVGAAGVVSGVLLPTGCVDVDRTGELMAAATSAHPALQFTFHRAFDLTPDLSAALHTLIDMGVKRVLTSGGCNDALAGQERIKSLVSQSAGRIAILAGGGLDEHNIPGLLGATPGLREVHASMRSFAWGPMLFRKEGVFMGGEKRNNGLEAEYGRKAADETRVRIVTQLLATMSAASVPDATGATASSASASPQQQQQQQP